MKDVIKKSGILFLFILIFVLNFYDCDENEPNNPPVNQKPVADFNASKTVINAGGSVNFTDLTTNNPKYWVWTFQGGNPGSSTTQNPWNIKYNTPGVYTVTLVATNDYGSDTKTKTGYITVQLLNNPCPGLASFTYMGQVYHTVLIGSQCWMKENLNAGQLALSYNTGFGHTDVIDNDTIEKYCYLNDTTYCDTFGALYDWNEMMNYVTTPGARGICPAGWHVPTEGDWYALEHYVDPTINDPAAIGWRGGSAGTELKYAGGTGMNIFMSGHRDYTGEFYETKVGADFWTSSETNFHDAYARHFTAAGVGVLKYEKDKQFGLSLRCVLN